MTGETRQPAKRDFLLSALAVGTAAIVPQSAAAKPAAGTLINDPRLQQYLDREDIAQLARYERYCRDQGLFDELAACYVAKSRVHISWFTGTGAAFAAASRKVRNSGFVSFHHIFPTLIDLNGDRAVIESYGEIHAPNKVKDVAVNLVSYCRFVSRVLRTAAGWKLVSFDCIYQLDKISTVDPAAQLPKEMLAVVSTRDPYRFLNAMGTVLGYKIDQEMPGDDRPDLVQALHADARKWLATGT